MEPPSNSRSSHWEKREYTPTPSKPGTTRTTPKITWPNFLLHFNKYGRTCINKMTAQAAGFHGAQNATRIPPDDQANTAATQQAGKSKDLFVSNGTPLFYCWSHGLSKTSEHTSKTCNNQGEGHCVNSRTASHASARAQCAPLRAH
jgi:hypothetical protein